VQRPIFFDPTGRRRRWTRRIVFALIALLIITALAFATTVATVPASQPLKLGFERPQPLPLRTQVGRLSRRLTSLFGRPAIPAAKQAQNLTIGFYSPNGGSGLESLKRQAGQLDWVAPTTMTIDSHGNFAAIDFPPMRRVLSGQMRRPLVIDVVQNIADGTWDGPATTRALFNPAQRASIIRSIDAALDANNDAGVMIDFEAMPANGIGILRQFIGELHARLAPKHRLVSVTVPIDDEAWNVRAFAQVADKVVLMAYDEHYMTGTPGPIASNNWFVSHLSDAVKGVPANKIIVALGSYAYDWHGDGHGGKVEADALTVEEAWLSALDSGTRPSWDKASGNAGFAFNDDNDANPATPGIRHDVWLIDAATSWNQMQVLGQLGIGSVALWRLGSEDPGFWPALASWRQGGVNAPASLRPNLGPLRELTNVDIEGNGEILRVDAVPTAGSRTLTYDPHSSLITNEAYNQMPMPYVVRRTGDKPKQIALTFDDGPDPKYTPQILSVLERAHVPGTFFVIGENGVGNRGILQRTLADGNEIGNHSYTHPNMADMSDTGIRFELNATQRLIEAYTGRSTRLFRAPYFGDAEPTTPDELGPALIAQQQGYTIVGLHGDPGDWQKRTADDIYQRTIDAVEQATPDRTVNIVLMHDGGGDRSQTVLALPRIIARLRADGYTFVPVSQLAGLDRDAVMPKVEGWDLVAVRLDVGIFVLLAALLAGLNWMFFFAIALGVIRALGMTALALFADRDEDMQPPADDIAEGETPLRPLVSVIIPAFNEERVIESSVRRILASDYHQIEVIVADDGSKDRTSEIVAASFGDEPRVRLMTMVNGGKARALNRAMLAAKGDIIVALDADTQFEPETIARLVRWFGREDVGAVAGNAKVGNKVNIVTRWQAVEYITAQNIERRALTRFDAIMVVPGAVGAWRRKALEDVGGYPEDTLAEDQDLTIAIQRHGWKIAYDEDAVAWTEAPETLRALGKQRFRWAYGTLQCLWKHRSVLSERSPSGLAFVGMPQAWMFQIVFAMISPLIDLALAISIIGTIVRTMQHGWAQTQTDVLRMGVYWIGFTAIDVACGWVAYRLDVREKHYPAFLLLAQRFVYRQLMYSVVIRAVGAATAGLGIGWGKMERTGRVNTQA